MPCTARGASGAKKRNITAVLSPRACSTVPVLSERQTWPEVNTESEEAPNTVMRGISLLKAGGTLWSTEEWWTVDRLSLVRKAFQLCGGETG